MNLFSTFFLAAFIDIETLAFSFTRSKCELNKRDLIRAIVNKDKEVTDLYRLNNDGEPERICAPGYNLLWDMYFCMKVCGLQTGDTCLRTAESGIDTCQPLVTFDFSSSSS